MGQLSLASDTLPRAEFCDHPAQCHRYVWRAVWQPEKPAMMALMVNPSKADAEKSDPTVSRCVERAKRGGWGGLVVTNLFALRSTEAKYLLAPEAVYPSCSDPIGYSNDQHILREAERAGQIVCGWGSKAGRLGRLIDARAEVVLQLLAKFDLYAFAVMDNGKCGHPLFVRYGRPVPWRPKT